MSGPTKADIMAGATIVYMRISTVLNALPDEPAAKRAALDEMIGEIEILQSTTEDWPEMQRQLLGLIEKHWPERAGRAAQAGG